MKLTEILQSKLPRVLFRNTWISYLRRYLNTHFGGYILAFHSDISVERYRQQIEALRPDQPVHVSELLDRLKRGHSTAGLFAITVDDGCRGQVLRISEVAIKLKQPVTFYLPTDFINGKSVPGLIFENIIQKIPPVEITSGGHTYDLTTAASRNRFLLEIQQRMHSQKESAYAPAFQQFIQFVTDNNLLTHAQVSDAPQPVTWDEVTRLSQSDYIGFESHGVTHQAVSSLSEKELEEELVHSKEQISAYSGREVKHFCYPYGSKVSIGDKGPQIVARHYESAVTLNRGRIQNKKVFELPRIPLYEKDDHFLTTLKLLTR